ncbi:MAG: hypothetical protein JSV59_11940 [Flavobacteriaceae bacterium]|nr:MAG: hypothetical protein JSV59_11940 [Flavobacteriaceae bacterium]
MKKYKKISFSIVSLVLIFFLALPSVIQLIHASDHLSINCDNAFESHVHVKELDCDFNKFTFSHHFYLPIFKIQLIAEVTINNEFSLNYNFSPESDSPLFSLRAPPSFS